MPPKPKVQIHDVNPFLQKVRSILLGREHTLANRFQENLATRSPPPPILPDGVTHKLSANYYYTRDARREVAPPTVLHSSKVSKQIEAEKINEIKAITPGKVYKWD